jgi:hypothetical protein
MCFWRLLVNGLLGSVFVLLIDLEERRLSTLVGLFGLWFILLGVLQEMGLKV